MRSLECSRDRKGVVGAGAGWERGLTVWRGQGVSWGGRKEFCGRMLVTAATMGTHPVPRTVHLENGRGGKLYVMCVFLA